MPPEEQLVFGPTVEGLFVRGLKPKLSPTTIADLRRASVDVEKPILPAYSRQVISEAVGLAARALYPDADPAEAWYRIGKHVALGVRGMPLGGAALALMRVLGPRRAMGRMARTFRSTNNYMAVRLRELAPNRYELDLEPSNEQPRYMQAVIEDLLEAAGAQELRVEIALHDRARELATYRISWR
jgi:uncharacterized protein (TIGR02265 family)